ncbi:uncharacterized protein MELLADRAFT_63160 [Melampsora larici-populina 98AG31]|uniref:Uncharacterized protein n=1 Tax=Melampsora larici-populina (strain 98AG31 / pathotype 3-4-7) TaxID=747676 RepID=F4RLN0_MELLP|nr:uncharacterized protein MELLADRAFT_63160 [Melampsora larici-populina 98AG31]EGG06561.1 hypothetical protein MELLADRAFT_63160 [Melampsora larici-populina 98AG31]
MQDTKHTDFDESMYISECNSEHDTDDEDEMELEDYELMDNENEYLNKFNHQNKLQSECDSEENSGSESGFEEAAIDQLDHITSQALNQAPLPIVKTDKQIKSINEQWFKLNESIEKALCSHRNAPI